MLKPPLPLRCATIFLLLLTRVAAADVQVSYTVDDKSLKSAVSGTTLTIGLWSDPACTTAVGSALVAIDDVDLIERLKRFKPTGGTKPPATARMTEAVAGITPPPPLFASVTGAGVTPVGGACQLQYASSSGTTLPCASQVGNEVYFTGCNVNIRNGTGDTYSSPNAVGNLILGYNENYSPSLDRGGSHDLVIGNRHAYPSSGGIVAGFENTLSGDAAALTGGVRNEASGFAASVSGGQDGTASGNQAAVSGGSGNVASGSSASVSGGGGNTASGGAASVAGGQKNVASGTFASVGGGLCNLAGSGTMPSCPLFPGGPYASVVSGGLSNVSNAEQSVVSGGIQNIASADRAVVSGGACNTAGAGSQQLCGATAGAPTVSGGLNNLSNGSQSVVSGGRYNRATTLQSTVGGGFDVTSSGQDDWDAGRAPVYHSDF